MRIKSILLLLVCFLLTGLIMPAVACPPGDCDDCETWNEETKTCDWDCTTGQCCQNDDCVATCSGCYKCVDNYCEQCKCWDDGNPITGSINVQDAKLCEEVTHTSSISDTDHWFKGGNGGEGCEGSPSDTIYTYSWSKTTGTNPESGTFTGTTDEDTVEWRAPPCTGTVNIKLTADDKPDSMDNPCPDSDRNDDSEDFEGTSTVSLPDGCTTGTKGAIFTLTKTSISSAACEEKEGDACGLMDNPENFSYTVHARYDQCEWVFDVEASAEAPTGTCPSNYINVESGNEDGITEDNYDIIVFGFRSLNGCISTGGNTFSNSVCSAQHENNHFEQFEEELEKERLDFLTKPCMSDMPIVCGDSSTETCQNAVTARYTDIVNGILSAYATAYANSQDEVEAEAAARACFEGIADIVEAYWE